MSAYKPSLSLFLSLPLLIINTNTGGELNYNIYDIYGTSSDTDTDTDTDRYGQKKDCIIHRAERGVRGRTAWHVEVLDKG